MSATTNKPTPVNPIVVAAKKYVGKDFHPGQKAQCMVFTRQVLTDAKSKFANVITDKPVDKHWTGRELASSLAGRDIGVIVDKIANLKPGAVVFFNDTYDEGWGPGTITHVGVYIGDGQMVHRPTMARPVEQTDITSGYWKEHFRCGLLTG